LSGWKNKSNESSEFSRRGRKEMNRQDPQKLADNLEIPCYACEKQTATHLCRYQVGELAVQVCLCENCMKIDTECLLKDTIGIQDLASPWSIHSMAQL
jgi:hypothetical protein